MLPAVTTAPLVNWSVMTPARAVVMAVMVELRGREVDEARTGTWPRPPALTTPAVAVATRSRIEGFLDDDGELPAVTL